MSIPKIIKRLERAQAAYYKTESLGGDKFENATEEYCRAWDAASDIWNAANEAEALWDFVEARKLWALLAPFDAAVAARLREIS